MLSSCKIHNLSEAKIRNMLKKRLIVLMELESSSGWTGD